jgi:thioredoxin-dependent peroxiredoxin
MPKTPAKSTKAAAPKAPKAAASKPAAAAVAAAPMPDKDAGAGAGPDTGAAAPKFSLPGDDGKPIDLAKLKGKPVVLYFYPKDDTSGCTAEAKDFTCLIDQFTAAGAAVIGVSPDSVASHAKFIAKHELGVRLAADEEKTVSTAYGVWVEKSMYGKKYMGVERATFLIDAKGRIAEVWRKVKVPGHADAVLAAVKALK